MILRARANINRKITKNLLYNYRKMDKFASE